MFSIFSEFVVVVMMLYKYILEDAEKSVEAKPNVCDCCWYILFAVQGNSWQRSNEDSVQGIRRVPWHGGGLESGEAERCLQFTRRFAATLL